MLDTADLNNPVQDPPDTPGGPKPTLQHVRALLNGAPIDAAVDAVVAYGNQPGQISRPWAASPFRLATTVCNLRGVPFKVSHAPALGSFTGTDYVEHDDSAWFALPNVVGPGDGAIAGRMPNEFWLSITPQEGDSSPYQTLGDFARASAAMPVGLPSRPLSRPAEHYLYRPYARVDDTGAVKIAWPMPDRAELDDVMAGQPYSFTGVDGGTLNNDPVKIAHDALTGVGAHNPQGADEANRALLLIDPLADAPSSVTPAWPVDALTRPALQQLQQQIEARARGILGKLQADELPGFAGWLLALVALGGVSETIASDVVTAFTQSLTSRDLLSPAAQNPVAEAQANGGLSNAG
jgi:hypothetical protein